MEIGFYHPSRGYWQTLGRPSNDIVAGYPEGTVQVPLKPSQDHEWDGSEWVYSPPPVTKEEIHKERDRRIEKGLTIQTSAGTIVAIQGDATSREHLTNLKAMAQDILAFGLPDLLTFRDGDNIEHHLTPQEVGEVWRHGVMHVEQVYKASWVIKKMDPVPRDFTDDKYWTAIPDDSADVTPEETATGTE